MIFRPHRYQLRAIDATLHALRTIGAYQLWLGLGMGKTAITASVIDHLLDRWEVGKVLILAPKRVATQTWPAEFEKWDHLGLHLPVVVAGSEKQRLRALETPGARIHITNYENLRWLAKQYYCETAKSVLHWPWDMVVADEFSKFKHQSSKRTEMMNFVRWRVRMFLGLTGTPAGNGLRDLWSQAYLLDQGKRLGNTEKAFMERWYVRYRDKNGYVKRKPATNAKAHIEGALRDITLSMRSEDYLDLPPRIDIEVPVDLPPDCMKQYREFERKMVLKLDSGTVEAANAGVLTGKCQQLSNGAVYLEDGKTWAPMHDAKLDALDGVLSEADGPVLLFYSFKSDRDRIMQRFPQAQLMDKAGNQVGPWNRGEIPLLLAHPDSAGHGLNLQDGGAIVVWFGLTWNLELYLQAVGRLHRQGQKLPVRNIHIVARDTVEQRLTARLRQKAEEQNGLLVALSDEELIATLREAA